MLRVLALLGMMLVSANLSATEQTRYISDNIYIYMHGGPSNKFRIIGSIEAGQPVQFTGQSQNEYAQIIDPKGRTGWIRTEYMSNSPSFRTLVPQLESSLQSTQNKLNQAISSKSGNELQISTLSSKVDELKASLDKTTIERDKARAELQKVINNQDFLKWREGGIIAGIGLILGLIITYLPKPQRRNKERWM